MRRIELLFVICNLTFVIFLTGCGKQIDELQIMENEGSSTPITSFIALSSEATIETAYIQIGDIHFKIVITVPKGAVEKDTEMKLLITEKVAGFDSYDGKTAALGPALIFMPADIVLKKNVELEINYEKTVFSDKVDASTLVFNKYLYESKAWQGVANQTNDADNKITKIKLSSFGIFRFSGREAEKKPVVPTPPETPTTPASPEAPATPVIAPAQPVTPVVPVEPVAPAPVSTPEVQPDPNQVVSIAISPNATLMDINNNLQFTASAKNYLGNTINPTFSWSVEGGIGAIDTSGIFRATSAGTGKIKATAGGITAEIALQTIDPDPLIRSVIANYATNTKNANPSIRILTIDRPTINISGNSATADATYYKNTIENGTYKSIKNPIKINCAKENGSWIIQSMQHSRGVEVETTDMGDITIVVYLQENQSFVPVQSVTITGESVVGGIVGGWYRGTFVNPGAGTHTLNVSATSALGESFSIAHEYVISNFSVSGQAPAGTAGEKIILQNSATSVIYSATIQTNLSFEILNIPSGNYFATLGETHTLYVYDADGDGTINMGRELLSVINSITLQQNRWLSAP